jgi:hypothetical protein
VLSENLGGPLFRAFLHFYVTIFQTLPPLSPLLPCASMTVIINLQTPIMTLLEGKKTKSAKKLN